MYAVGGPSETLVLIKRTDINNPAGAGREGALDGYQVSLHVFARVKNGKITERYDAPLNKVSGAAVRGVGALPSLPAQPAQPPNIPLSACRIQKGASVPRCRRWHRRRRQHQRGRRGPGKCPS